MIQFLLNSLLYFPSRHIALEPDAVGLSSTEVHIQTEDGERLHAWWIPARPKSVGHILLFHGNAGNIGDRLLHAQLLTAAGFDVLLFDYRGYGRSTGKPDEEGIYRDARAAGSALVRREGVDPCRVFYLGESLGGAVALALAREVPPRGLILVSTFTSVREMGRLHYPVLPSALVPDAFPNLTRIRGLECPLLLMHGDRDDIVPIDQGQALFEAAPEPKRRHVFEGLGHNDILVQAGAEWTEAIAVWVAGVLLGPEVG